MIYHLWIVLVSLLLVSCQYITVVHFIWNFRCFRVILEGAISYYYNHFIDILIDILFNHR